MKFVAWHRHLIWIFLLSGRNYLILFRFFIKMKWNRAHSWDTLPTDSTLLSITKLGAVDKYVVCNVYLSNKMHSLQYKETKYKSRQHFIRKAFRDQSVSLKYKRKNMTTGYIFHSCKCIWHNTDTDCYMLLLPVTVCYNFHFMVTVTLLS